MNLARYAFPLVLLGLGTTCSPTPVTWQRIHDTGSVAAQAATAKTARDALANRLLKELQGAMASGGPAAGIEVCSRRAPAIAKEVAAEMDVKIGRTSQRLRNPANTPPSWARAAVSGQAKEPHLFRSSTGTLGALYPIQLGAQCTVCHGAKESLSAPVQAALAARYPKDTATGFAPGDLRGWFWVEVE